MRATNSRLISQFLVRMVKIQTDEQISIDCLNDQFSNQQTFPKHVSSFQYADCGNRPWRAFQKSNRLHGMADITVQKAAGDL